MVTYRFIAPLKCGIFKRETSATTPVTEFGAAPLMIEVPLGTLARGRAAILEVRIRELLDDMMSTLNKEFGG